MAMDVQLGADAGHSMSSPPMRLVDEDAEVKVVEFGGLMIGIEFEVQTLSSSSGYPRLSLHTTPGAHFIQITNPSAHTPNLTTAITPTKSPTPIAPFTHTEHPPRR